MVDPSQNIPLGNKASSGLGISEEKKAAQSQLIEDAEMTGAQAQVLAKKSKQITGLAINTIVAGLQIDLDTPDEKEYSLEADEINELFRVSQQQNGGICTQLCLVIATLLYILIDTIQNHAIQGSLGAVTYFTEDQYLLFLKQQQDFSKLGGADHSEYQVEGLTPELREQLAEFYNSTDWDIISDDISVENAGEDNSDSERAGRVLKFLRTPDQFYLWLRFVLRRLYAPRIIPQPGQSFDDLINDLNSVTTNFCLIPDGVPVDDQNIGRVMMNSNYVAGSRLQVYHASTKGIDGESAFQQIKSEVRQHTKSDPKFGSLTDEHYKQDAFTDYKNTEFGDLDDDGLFTMYFPGDMSCQDANDRFDFVLRNEIVSQEMLTMQFQIMLYAHDARQGNIFTWTIHQTNQAIFRTYLEVKTFMPENNGVTVDDTWIRVSLQAVFLVCIILLLIQAVIVLRDKCRQLCVYRLNEFNLQDLVGYAMLIDGIAILVTNGILAWSDDFKHDNWVLPLATYDDYVLWVENADLQFVLRVQVGVFCIIEMINILLSASAILPSLGILFRTIEKSLGDVFVFTTITSLIFFVFVIIFHISFGEQNYFYSTVPNSFLTCFEMFLGEISYTTMYKADPQVSAALLVLFVVVMNFMAINMYTAIVIRTYNKLQARQMFLGESMALILRKKAKKKFEYFKNLLLCKSTFNKPKNGQEQAKSDQADDAEDNRNNQKFSQKLQQNFAKCMRNKVTTKDKFERELKNAAFMVANEKKKSEKERLKKLSGDDAVKSYNLLKNGCILLIHLIISVVFQVSWLESTVHSDLRAPISYYLDNETFGSGIKLKTIQSTYVGPIDRITQYDLSQIGNNRAVGDTFRLTFRMYSQAPNEDPNTQQVFPNVKESQFGLQSLAQDQSTWWVDLTQTIIGLTKSKVPELTSPFVFAGMETQYMGVSNEYDSFYGEGGYVFNFDENLNLKDMSRNLSLRQFLFATAQEGNQNQLGLFSLDWVMFNVNYDCFIYVALLFKYLPNGELKITQQVTSVRAVPMSNQLITLLVFFVFYCYFTWKLCKDLWSSFNETANESQQKKDQDKNQPNSDDDQRRWWTRLGNFIGIDQTKLVGANFLVVIVLVIAMVLKKIVTTTLYLIRAIYRYCAKDLFNLVELVNCVFNSAVLVVLVQIIPMMYGSELKGDNPILIQSVNRVAYLLQDFYFYQAMSIFCLCIRVLKLPSFSLIANLPFETMAQGRKDIQNILIILGVFTLANSLSAYIVFCSQVKEFENLTTAFYSVLKIYLGDFSLVAKMYSVAADFTTFFLFICMTLYSIFLTPMFLGIIVGHFEIEWARVKNIQITTKQSFQIHHVIARVLSKYFTNLHEAELNKIQRANKSKPGQSSRGGQSNRELQTKKKRCRIPCTCSSFRPSGIIERFVVWCMINCACCRKKKVESKILDQAGLPDTQMARDMTKMMLGNVGTLNLNPEKTERAKDIEEDAGLLHNQEGGHGQKLVQTFDKNLQQWGQPNQLKHCEEFTEHNVTRTFMNWFDGWSTEQYQRDFDKYEYNKGKKIKSKIQTEDFDKTKISEEELKVIRSKLPASLEDILNLEQYWNEDVDEYEKANSNYWMYHLQKQVLMLTKKELSLYNFKSMDCFFQQNLINRSELTGSIDLSSQLSEKQQQVFFLETHERFAWFSDRTVSVEDKYQAWKAIDMVARYKLQKDAFKKAHREKKRFFKKNRGEQQDEDDKAKKPNHNDLMTLLIAQIERPISEDMEKYIHDYCVVTNIGKPQNGKNPLKFEAIKAKAWRDKKYHRCFDVLQKVWRECLSEEEKFEFWFNQFNTMERVRLWNQLVFTRQWFRRVVKFSRKQPNYLKAVATLDKHKKDQQRKAQKKALKEKNKGKNKDGDDDDDDEDMGNNNTFDKNFYKGFHRKDLNDMLKKYANEMYNQNIRNEELLIIKIKPDLKTEIIKREHIGGTTSFFNEEKDGERKEFRNLTQKYNALTEDQELQVAREVFNPDEMLTMWNQFFEGTYMQIRERKQKREIDKDEDGIDHEFNILRLIDEDNHNLLFEDSKMPEEQFKQYWVDYKSNEQSRTMDRYDQIHHFFQIIIEHNTKTLKSCEDIRQGVSSTVSDEEDKAELKPKSILKNKGAAASENVDDEDENENEPIRQKSKYEMYRDVRELVIDDEERLPLWMLMTKEEKLDMLAHQCIDDEARIMGLLIEFEYGAENRFEEEGPNLHVDTLLENALNQMIFQKYLAYTRLQATFYARKFTKDLITKTQEQSIKLYNYGEYLYDLNKILRKHQKTTGEAIETQKEELELIEAALRHRAEERMDTFKQEQSPAEKTKVALALKFFYDFKEKMD